MYEIKRLDVASFAKAKAIILGSIMFVVGLFWILAAIVAGIIRSAYGTTLYEGTGIGYSVGSGLTILIFGTILGAVAGFILGAIIASLYNLLASKFGGLKIEMNSVSLQNSSKNNRNKKNDK